MTTDGAAGSRRRPSPARLLARGLVRHCPRCGAGHLFKRWFTMVERCPGCGLRFAREEGFFLGAFVINLALTEVGLAAVLAVFIALEASGGAPVAPMAAAGVLETVLVPLAGYPFSKTVWCAVDLIMHGGQAGPGG